MSSWSINHISAVTLAVFDMADSVAFYHRVRGSKEKHMSVDPRAGQPADASMLVNIPLAQAIGLYQVGTPG